MVATAIEKRCYLLQEQLRPPVYNPEDYAAALRKWGRRLPAAKAGSLAAAAAAATAAAAAAAAAAGSAPPAAAAPGSALSTSSLSASMLSLTLDSGEMTLRQFDSIAVLLDKLRADLNLAFPRSVFISASSLSFVGNGLILR